MKIIIGIILGIIVGGGLILALVFDFFTDIFWR